MFDQLRDHFEAILIILFAVSAIAYVIYRFTLHKKVEQAIQDNQEKLSTLSRKEKKVLKKDLLFAQLNSPVKKILFLFADLFWVLLFVVVVRSFVFEPFIIPSGSMKPGLTVGDIIIVDKNELGFRMPISNKRLTEGSEIKRGDVIVFRYPENPKISYIKRVVGLPGDRITYDNRNLMINNNPIKLTPVKQQTDSVNVGDDNTIDMDFSIFEESFEGEDSEHLIRYNNRYVAQYPNQSFTVPEGNYFVMGDNRDHSSDGRAFGFLSDDLIIGKASSVVFNYRCFIGGGNCGRFFKAIK